MGKYAYLKSGTDVRGSAVEYEGKKIDLSDEAVYEITASFVEWLAKKCKKPAEDLKISVGHDSRISAGRISKAAIKALKASGAHTYFFGMASTPAMFMSVVKMGLDGAIEITASHHPFYRNGLKFFTSNGGVEAAEVAEILSGAENKIYSEGKSGTVENYDFMPEYAGILKDLIKKEVNSDDYERPLKGKKIIVDAGNGAGGFYAYDVLKPLGADISGSRYLEPDGYFPNHIPNPENEDAMKSACEAAIEAGAELGVVFDTDVDRAGAVDSRGREINRNKLLALAAAIITDGKKDSWIVTDSVTSDGLKEFIEKDLHSHHYRFVRGYKNVIDEAVRLNRKGLDAPMAGETSGHIAFRENYFLDDGAYLITKIIIKSAVLSKQGRTIDELISNLKEPTESKELRFDISASEFKNYGNTVIKSIEDYCASHSDWIMAKDSHEGVRVKLILPELDGWFLLRVSVHDPVIPLNIESNAVGGALKIAEKVYGVMKDFDELNLTPIKEFLSEN